MKPTFVYNSIVCPIDNRIYLPTCSTKNSYFAFLKKKQQLKRKSESGKKRERVREIVRKGETETETER